MRKLINEDSSVTEFQSNFSTKDAIFSIALAWNAVKSVNPRRRWKQLWPSVTFTDESSDKEDLEAFNVPVRPMQTTVRQILETVKNGLRLIKVVR
jgi:hypothetical protein